MAVADERALQLVESILPAFVGDADTGRLEVAGISPGLVPCGLPEAIVGLLENAQELIDDTQIEDGFTVVGIGIATLQHLYGRLQIGLCLLETGTTQIPESHLHVAAIVHRIATQGLLVIVEGRPRSMTVLLQMKTCEVELVNGFGVLWREGSLCGIRDGTYLIGLWIPLQQRELSRVVSPFDDQMKISKMFFASLHRFHEHLFRTQCYYLVIILFALLAVENNSYVLLRGGQNLELCLAIGCLLDVHHEVLRGLFHDADFAIGHEILHKLLLLVGHEPREVGLVFGIDASHQFDIGSEAFVLVLVRQVTIPGTAKVAITPGPLFLTR